jgi:type III secretory pathway component EscS
VEKIGFPALVSRLFQEALDVGRAEIKLAKTRMLARLRAARTGLILLVVALLFALAGLVGLIVGLVLALAPLVGAALAGVILLVAALVIAGALAFAAGRMLSGQTVEDKS